MSKIALKILKGEKPKDIQVTFSEANEYVFNYNGIKRYNINENLIPKNSKIINKPFSLYEEYQFILLNLITIFLLVIFVFIVLLIYIKYKNKSSQLQNDYLIVSMIRFAPFFIIPITTALIIWLFIYSTNKNHNQLKEIEKQNYIENMKQQSQREVDRYIQIVKSSVAIAKNKDELNYTKNSVINIAQNIKYGKSGYIIVGSMDGFMVSHPNKNLIGSNFFDGKHEKAKEVFIKFKDKIEKNGSGFVEYTWINPSSKVEEKKMTYVNYLSDFNWYVASGVYLDEVDRYIDNKIKNNAKFDEKNINILIITSIILLIFSFIISYILSLLIKNSFEQYKKNIIDEIKKVKTIEKAKEEVDIQKEEFERLFEDSPIAMAFAQNDGFITKRNSRFIKIFGYTNEDVSTVEGWYKAAYPEQTYRQKIVDIWNKEINEASKNNGMITPMEVTITDKSGEQHDVIISSIVLKNGILASFIDLTKQKQQEKLIHEQAKLVSMGEMIGNIAHQWRQPLSIISTSATGLKLQQQYNTLTDEQFIKACDTINDNAQYLSKTIDDFRDFIKGDRKKVQFNLQKNIESFLHLVEGTIKNNYINIITDIDDKIMINAYPNELVQCFINIFNNSKDALNKTNDDKYIFISTERKINKVYIKFKDNGGGIPIAVMQHIFEPYFTTKHKSVGTGLGLHMTYNLIVEGMNGMIKANNVVYEYNGKEYNGAEFTITLPLT